MDPLQWCRDRLLVPGHPLLASLLFVPEEQRARILALKALVAELAALDDPGMDSSVRAAKSGWWLRALSEGAAHPALEALQVSRAAEQVPPPAFLPLFQAITSGLEGLRLERYEQLWAHALAIGGEAARLELSLSTGFQQGHEAAAMQLGAAGYLFRLVRDLAVDAAANRWLVPLDLQAQFQVGRSDVLDRQGGPGWDGLVRTLLERAVRAGQEAALQLPHVHRHLHLYWALDRRLASRLARRPGDILARRVVPGHAGNVWVAWRAARRLKD